jgi:hypothetical protein
MNNSTDVDLDVDAEASRIVSDICSNVLDRVMREENISEFGVCGIDLSDPESCLTVALAAMASK